MVGLALFAPRFVTLVQKLGGRVVLISGLSMQILSALLLIPTMTNDTPDIYLIPSLALSGIFIFFAAVGLAVAGFANIPVRRISNARTIYFGARQLGNSMGISLGLVLLDQRESFHSRRLYESFFLRNHSFLSAAPHLSSKTNIQDFGSLVLQQATILSYQDMFVAVVVVSCITIACTWLLPGKQQNTSTSSETAETTRVANKVLEKELSVLE